MGTRRSTRTAALVTGIIAVTALAFPGFAAASSRTGLRLQTPVGSCPSAPSQLVNNGFEQPRITTGTYQIIDESTVPGWSTTAADGKMELWNSGFQGVPAAEGLQFAELNANLVSTLYQDIPTTPGQTLIWGLSHRGRQGVDTMNVRIGEPGSSLTVVATVSDGNTAWGRHTGVYTVPAGQVVTRFAFESVSAAGGNKSIGNFLDAISFGTPSCVTIDKSVTPSGTRNVGDVLRYTVRVSNKGGSPTASANISDVLPTDTTFVPGSIQMNTGSSVIPVADSAYNAGTHTIALNLAGSTGTTGVIEPGQSTELSFSAVVDTAAAGTTLSNSASVSSTSGLGGVTNLTSDPVLTPVATYADLDVTKTATDSVAPGGTVTYTLTAHNSGPGNAVAVGMTDTLPTGFTIDVGSVPVNCANSGTQVLLCNLGTMAVGDTVTKTFTATAANPLASGTYVNNVRVTSTTFDVDRTNNEAWAPTIVTPPAPATLDVFKSAATNPSDDSVAGQLTSVQIIVTNRGQVATAAVDLTDTIPTGFTVIDAASGAGSCTVGADVSCTLGVINGGDSVLVTITGVIDPTIADGATLSDTATATDGTLTDAATADITVAARSELVTTKAVFNDPVADQPVLYGFTVFNSGPSAALNVIATDSLPAGVTVLSVPGGCTVSGTAMPCDLGDIAVGDSVTVLYPVALPGGGTFTNTVDATTDTPLVDPDAASAEHTIVVTTGADLAITKTVDRDRPKVGDTVTYTLTVTNNGPGNATNVGVRDVTSDGVALQQASADRGTTDLTGDVLWTMSSLGSGQTATATVTAIVAGECTQNNTAFVDSDMQDPDGSNNTSTASVEMPKCSAIANTGLDAMPLTDTGLAMTATGGLLLYLARRRRFRAPTCLD